jgi:hypothetical protein
MLTTGNLLEVIKYKITDLKHSQLPTHTYYKNFNEIMEELVKDLDWLTTGKFAIKIRNSKKVRNYRPIPCLKTRHKITNDG